MEIWHYDRRTGAFVEMGLADPDPLNKGSWLIPAYATNIRPPYVPPGCIAIFNGGWRAEGEWRIEFADNAPSSIPH